MLLTSLRVEKIQQKHVAYWEPTFQLRAGRQYQWKLTVHIKRNWCITWLWPLSVYCSTPLQRTNSKENSAWFAYCWEPDFPGVRIVDLHVSIKLIFLSFLVSCERVSKCSGLGGPSLIWTKTVNSPVDRNLRNWHHLSAVACNNYSALIWKGKSNSKHLLIDSTTSPFAETNYLNIDMCKSKSSQLTKRSPVGWFLESLQQTYNFCCLIWKAKHLLVIELLWLHFTKTWYVPCTDDFSHTRLLQLLLKILKRCTKSRLFGVYCVTCRDASWPRNRNQWLYSLTSFIIPRQLVAMTALVFPVDQVTFHTTLWSCFQVFFYSNTIFDSAGIPKGDPQDIASVVVGVVNVIMTIVSVSTFMSRDFSYFPSRGFGREAHVTGLSCRTRLCKGGESYPLRFERWLVSLSWVCLSCHYQRWRHHSRLSEMLRPQNRFGVSISLVVGTFWYFWIA